METVPRTPYPTDASDEECALLVSYLTLMRQDVPQRKHSLRELVNGLRYIARTGLQWRFRPNDLPPWAAVYPQPRRWIEAGVVALIADLRELIRLGSDLSAQPSAMIRDRRTLQSTPESGDRAGWDGAKRRKGTKVHLVVDTLGLLLALHVTPANAQDRAQVEAMAEAASVDQGSTGAASRQAAAEHGIQLEVPDVKHGFVLLPRRWVVERDFGGMSRFRRLARDQERLAAVLNGLHLMAFTMLMWKQALPIIGVP
jgi:transposase